MDKWKEISLIIFQNPHQPNPPYILSMYAHFISTFNPIQLAAFSNCSSSSSICVITPVYQTTEKEILLLYHYHTTWPLSQKNIIERTTRLLSPIKWYVYIIDAVTNNMNMYVCLISLYISKLYSMPAAGFGFVYAFHFVSWCY